MNDDSDSRFDQATQPLSLDSSDSGLPFSLEPYSLPTTIRTYEALSGSEGAAIRYRPARYDVADLIGGRRLELRVNGQRRMLRDVAMNGLAFRVPRAHVRPIVGDELNLELSLEGLLVFRGQGEVVRRAAARSSVTIGLRLTSGFIDIPGVIEADEVRRLHESLTGGSTTQRDTVPAAYRDAVDAIAHFIQYTRNCLEDRERRLSSTGRLLDSTRDALAAQAAEALAGQWATHRARASSAARPHMRDARTRDAMKAYSEVLITRPLECAPMVSRGYRKPLGYPGDYEEMRLVYRNLLEGPTAFARTVHRLGCNEALAEGVRTRKEMMRGFLTEEHRRVVAQNGAESVFRATSLGCGVALEVEEYVRAEAPWEGRVEWVLADQEERALSLAHEGVYRAMADGGGLGSVDCLHLSFNQVIEANELSERSEPRDIIYSVGLFDYLGEQKAQRLVEKLVAHLAPGGLLAVGNAREDPENWWFPEMVLDWTLIYRTEEQMRRLAALVADQVTIEVKLEPARAYWFLLLRKRA